MSKAHGEKHPKAKLTDHDCDLVRQLHDRYGIPYVEMAEKFECGKSTIADIVKYKTRIFDKTIPGDSPVTIDTTTLLIKR